MSYFSIDADKIINEEKIMQQMTHEKTMKKAPHSVPHTPEARKKIADTQRERYRMIEALIKKAKQKSMTEDRVKEICHEVLNEYLNRNTKPMNNNRPMNINL
jgi:hypothetical protein